MGQQNFDNIGQPLRLHEMDIQGLTKTLYDQRIRWKNGKVIGEIRHEDGTSEFVGLHDGQKQIVESPARFKVVACGRRFGKCQSEDSIIQTADGKIHKIGDLVGKEIEIYALNDDYEYVKTKATVHDNGVKSVYKIRTKYGLTLERTDNHPLLTVDGWGSIKTGELKEGVRIAVPTTNPYQGVKTYDKNQLALLGYLMGDGKLSGSNPRMFISEQSPEIKDHFLSLLDGTYKMSIRKGCYDISLHRNNSVVKLIRELGLEGKNSYTKFIPNFIYELDNEHVAEFLKYLYTTDGWAYQQEIGYCSASKDLAEGVKRLLSRFGIVSCLYIKNIKSGKYNGNSYHQLVINNTSETKKFMDLIGIPFKHGRLKPKSKNSFNSQITTMPKSFCKRFSDKLKSLVSFRKQEETHGRVRGDRSVGKDKLLNYCDDNFESERKLIESDLYWDEIVEIEYVGEKNTTHLEVPKYFNYINDCVEHNTGVAALIAIAAFFQPNRRIWIVGPEYAHVEKVFQELYHILVNQLKVVGKHVQGSAARKSKGDYYIESPWGSIIEGKSGTNPDSMAGEAVDLVIYDEAGLEPNLGTIWRQMLRPTLGDKQGSGIFISTPRGKNDFYKLFKQGELGYRQYKGYEKVKDENSDFRHWASWSMPTYTNPFIPRSEYEDAKRDALLHGKYLLFKQEYDADFDSVSDAAFPEFKATIPDEENPDVRKPYHVQDYTFNHSFGMWFAACDYNIARPASTIYAQVDKEGNVMIFDELFKSDTTAYMQAEYIKEKERELGVPYSDVIGDVSGSFSTAKGMNEFNQMETVLGHAPAGIRQGRETGNHLIHEWLAYPIIDKDGNVVKDENGEPKTFPKLFIASHCVETIHAIETAKKKTAKDGTIKQDYREVPTGHEGLL